MARRTAVDKAKGLVSEIDLRDVDDAMAWTDALISARKDAEARLLRVRPDGGGSLSEIATRQLARLDELRNAIHVLQKARRLLLAYRKLHFRDSAL